jgi:predicted nucleic acid-binding protein
MTYFFDTSALLKRYHQEPGSAKVDELLSQPQGSFVIANITIAELTSAFVRKFHQGIIKQTTLKHVLSQFAKDILTDFWIIDLERHHVMQSRALILKHNLRALDGLQLSALLSLKTIKSAFVCADQRLLKADQKERVAVIAV